MTTTDTPPGPADDLPRRRRGRATAPGPVTDAVAGPADGGARPPGGPGAAAPPPASRRGRRAATRQDGDPVVLPPAPAQLPAQAPVGSPTGAVAAGVVGRSAYGVPDQPYPAQFAGYPSGAGEPVLDLDALARSGGALPPGVRTVGDLQVGPPDLQVGPATTPIRRRRPGSLPESFEVSQDGEPEPEADRATTPIRTQSRPPRTGALRLRRGSKGDASDLPAAPPVVSASPGGMPFGGAPPTGAMPLADAEATGLLRRAEPAAPPVPGRGGPHLLLTPDPVPGAGRGPGRAGPPEGPRPDGPRPPRAPHVSSGPTGPRDGVPVPPLGAPGGVAPGAEFTGAPAPGTGPEGPAGYREVPPGGASAGRRARRRAADDRPDGAPEARPDGRAVDGPAPSAAAEAEPAIPPRRNRAGRNLPLAILVGVGLAAIVLASLLVRKEAFVGVVCVASVLAVWELAGALAAKEITVPVVPLAVGSVGMLVSAFVAGEDGLLVSFALTSFGVLLWRIIDGPQDAARDVAASVFAAAYVPFLAGFTMLMLAAPDGAMRIIVFVLLVVASDTGGYTAGVLFGKHPMAPTVSPHKSWEGFAGSTLACVVAGAAGVVLLLHGVWYAGVAAGAAAVVTATVGDLSESLLKRDLGIKDMGHLLPGHGGMLDRIDSLLLTAPVVYVLLSLLVPVG